ncbi:hypothetical protein GWK41_07655 [Persephonella atlantica]|uniref:DUF5615 domain-containing protein n=1 Tax=Persephonella atlantica TaxID=2699429 RepID=A0ABS1GJ47_9AQUI|nr:DUF5615 family PIN-like protein [Persephonella atlantica]MBK3332941.1 hypothetical protein [Persephonella atlantica]
MKFLIDENIPKMLADKIVKKYPESIYVLNSNLQGKSDLEIFRFCKENRYVLVTMDSDFADIFEYPLKSTEGRILLRFKNLKLKEITEKTLKSLEIIEKKPIKESIVVISNNKIRIKKQE